MVLVSCTALVHDVGIQADKHVSYLNLLVVSLHSAIVKASIIKPAFMQGQMKHCITLVKNTQHAVDMADIHVGHTKLQMQHAT